MSDKKTEAVGDEGASVSIAAYEHPVIYEYVGKDRYLQATFCKSVAKLYSDKFGMYTTKALSNIAAEEGFIGLLEWSKQVDCNFDDSLFLSGAKGGHVDVLKFLEEQECPIPRSWDPVWIAAAERGYVGLLKFVRDLNYLHDIEGVCEIAAENGHVNILKWIYEVEGARYFTADTYKQAAIGGSLEIVQWLRGWGCDWDENTCFAAIGHGHVGVLKWAMDNGCPWDVNDKSCEGEGGLSYAETAEMIEFLISRGAIIDTVDEDGETPLSRNVDEGELEIVKILVRLGADVNLSNAEGQTPLDIAIMFGKHDIMEVLRAAGGRESA